GFAQLGFEHRDVLVGGRVEDRVGLAGPDGVAGHGRIAAVAKDRYALYLREVAAHLGLDRDQRQLVDFQQRDLARPVLGALAAQLRTDRATGAGDQHAAPAEPAADRLPVRRDRLAPEQVLDRDFLQLAWQRAPFKQVV